MANDECLTSFVIRVSSFVISSDARFVAIVSLLTSHRLLGTSFRVLHGSGDSPRRRRGGPGRDGLLLGSGHQRSLARSAAGPDRSARHAAALDARAHRHLGGRPVGRLLAAGGLRRRVRPVHGPDLLDRAAGADRCCSRRPVDRGALGRLGDGRGVVHDRAGARRPRCRVPPDPGRPDAVPARRGARVPGAVVRELLGRRRDRGARMG